MPIFAFHRNHLERIKEIPFDTESELQKITEQNLDQILGLEYVNSQVVSGGLRIDTLAFDNETKSFVIIEYKKDKNFSVIDQGYAYLSVLLNDKADFVLEYNESKDKTLRRDDVDWSQSRVVFVSPSFSKYQKQAINFKDLPIEIWEVARYEGGMIEYDQYEPPDTLESINTVSPKTEAAQRVVREVIVYTEDQHKREMPDEIVEMYNGLKARILDFGDRIEVAPKKHYIGFKANTNFVDVHFQKAQLKLWINLNAGELDDPKRIARDVKEIGHWGNGDYEIAFKPGDDLDYLMLLVKQSYKKQIT